MKQHPHRVPASGIVLALFLLLLMVGIVHGTLAFGCYLVNEHRRLVAHEIMLIWLGDAISVFWFLRYLVRWAMGRCTVDSERLPSRTLPRAAWFIILSLTFGLLAELGLTLLLRQDEFNAFGRAVPSVCTLNNIQARMGQGIPTYWKLDGEYPDAAGQIHPVTFYVREKDELQMLPPAIVQAIQQKQPLMKLPIVFDPQRPSRSWIPQIGWDDGNRLHYLSLLLLSFQFLFALLFFTILMDSVKKNRRLPWWVDLYNLLPLGTMAFLMALFGGLELYIIRRLCP